MAAARGMSSKVVGVEGKKLLEGFEDAETQDFVMQNHPIFFSRNAEHFLQFMQAIADTNTDAFFRANRETKKILDAIDAKDLRDPLRGTYWIPTPVSLGNTAMKYKVEPALCSPSVYSMSNRGDDFRRDNLKKRMAGRDPICMNFMVQLRTNPDKMPLDNAMVKWPEEGEGRFRHFATLVIPRGQNVESPEHTHFCEHLSMNIWHATKELTPLGSINEVRRAVYRRMAATRRQNNQPVDDTVTEKEPTSVRPIPIEARN